jgi:hypothetical protein
MQPRKRVRNLALALAGVLAAVALAPLVRIAS